MLCLQLLTNPSSQDNGGDGNRRTDVSPAPPGFSSGAALVGRASGLAV